MPSKTNHTTNQTTNQTNNQPYNHTTIQPTIQTNDILFCYSHLILFFLPYSLFIYSFVFDFYFCFLVFFFYFSSLRKSICDAIKITAQKKKKEVKVKKSTLTHKKIKTNFNDLKKLREGCYL